MNAYIKKKKVSNKHLTPQGTRKGRTTGPKLAEKKEIRAKKSKNNGIKTRKQ